MNISLHAVGKKKQKRGSVSLGFGLNSRKKNTSPGNNIFGDDGDSSDDGIDNDTNQRISRREVVNKQIGREQTARRRRAQADLALVKDKSVYDYDGAYDSFQPGTDASRETEVKGKEKKSKYIGDLMKTAKIRERERDAIFERRNARDQAEQDATDDFKGKEKFVTKSYKRKLQERKQWQAEEQEREREESVNDVSKKSAGAAFAGFYGNLNRSAILEQRKKNEKASSRANTDENEEDNKEETVDTKSLDDGDFDARQNFLGGFERSSLANTDGYNKDDDKNTKQVEDECDVEVSDLPKLSDREVREKKVAEARERYFQRKQAIQLEQWRAIVLFLVPGFNTIHLMKICSQYL